MKIKELDELESVDKLEKSNKLEKANELIEPKNLQDIELNEKVKTLARQERKLTQVILWHIAEVDKRKLFLRQAYPSLFEYLVQEIGYSAGAAQRRIDAARILQRIPEVAQQIETGAIHLSQISKVQKVCRQIKKQSGEMVQASVQKGILQKLENQSAEQTDLILAREFNLEVKTQEKKHIQKDESVRVELTFSKEEMAVIQKAQNLLSNKTGGALKDTLLEMAQRIVNSYLPKAAVHSYQQPKSANGCRPKTANNHQAASGNSLVAKNNQPKIDGNHRSTATVAVKSVTPRLKKEILHRDQVCQFRAQQTGRVCGAKQYLEIDHIQPRFAGGENKSENLRVLCKNHNRFRYFD